MITSIVTTNGEGDAMAKFEIGQRISATTRDHGHIARSKVKSFTGIVESVHDSATATGEQFTWMRVRLEPGMKAVRNFNTRNDSIEVIG